VSKNKVWKIIKIIWVVLSVLIFLWTSFTYLQALKSDSWEPSEVMVYLMLWITFPIGYLLGDALSHINFFLYSNYKFVWPNNYFIFTMSWLLFFVVGYFQWFVVVPYLFGLARKVFRKKNKIPA
jgi:hypothetical protein